MKTYRSLGVFLGLAIGSPLCGCDLGDGNVGDEHETTGSDSGDSGDDSDGDGDSGSDSSGAVGACDDYPFQATAEQLAATPRDDEDAEIIALAASGELTAPEALYQRVSDDLAAIRADNPALVDHHARLPWSQWMPVSFDEVGTPLMQAGTYEGWDCPNEHYGANVEPNEVLEDTAMLTFGDKRLHIGRLAEEYLELPNVIYTEVSGTLDGSYICLSQQGEANRYLFALGGGDCPAGCTEWDYWEYTVDGAGVVTLDGESTELPAGWTSHCDWE